jgi:hypothetical protein
LREADAFGQEIEHGGERAAILRITSCVIAKPSRLITKG